MSKLFENAGSAPESGQAPSGAETMVAGVNVPVNDSSTDTALETSTTVKGAESSGEVSGNEEKLILGKFKSQEDLERAYRQLEGFSTKNAQQLAELRKQAQTPAPRQPVGQGMPPQVQATAISDLNTQFTERFINDPVGTLQAVVGSMLGNQIAPLQQQQKDHELKLEMAAMGAKYGDFYTLGDQIQEVYKANPALWNLPNSLEMAYKIAKADYGADALKRAREAGRAEASQTLLQKQGLSVEGQQAKSGRTETPSPEDEVRASILKAGRGGLFRVE